MTDKAVDILFKKTLDEGEEFRNNMESGKYSLEELKKIAKEKYAEYWELDELSRSKGDEDSQTGNKVTLHLTMEAVLLQVAEAQKGIIEYMEKD